MDTTKTLLIMPKRTMTRLRALAKRRKTTVSNLLRAAVEKTYAIKAELGKEPFDWRNDPLIKFMDTLGPPADGGPNDTAENHDRYIYDFIAKKKLGS